MTIPAEVSDGTGRGSPDLHRRAESGADGPCSKSDGRRPAWWNGPRLFWPAWRANGTTRLAASLACGRIRWVCSASALRQLGWPDCGIGLGRARPPNMARICACGFCANWNCRRPRGWPVGMGLLWGQRWVPRAMRSGACCAVKAANCAGGARGASARTRNLRLI